MKKVLMTLAMLLALGAGVQAAGQKHRHTPQQQELVDSTNKDGVEVYSDTTSTDTTIQASKGHVTINTPMGSQSWDYSVDDEDLGSIVHNAFSELKGKDLAGILLVLGVLLIIFVLAPVLIIIALFYFINKNRKEKMRLAQMAMQQGQPIPDQLLNDSPASVNDEYQKGMRQCFVGVGLMVFLGYAAGNVGFGIGALVFCIGLGKVFASRTARKNNNDFVDNNRRDVINDNQI